MKVTFLGTGTSTGIPQIGCNCEVCSSTDIYDKRLRASVLIEVNEKHILIDCGPDFRQQMISSKCYKIDSILITHGHYDHVGGLDDVRPFGNVNVFAEKTVTNQIRQSMPYCFKENLYPGVPLITLNNIDTNTFYYNDILIEPIRVMHAELPILGYRIDNFAYITDLKTIDNESIKKLRNLDILVLNALRHKSHISHININEAIELSKIINAKKTYFTHFSHDAGKHAELKKQLPENIFLSYDNLVLEF